MPDIVVSALVMRNAQGHFLGVRKKGTAKFMMPGGKPEPGETPEETIRRETTEELGITLGAVVYLGKFSAPAANEAGHRVVADVFESPYLPGVAPAAEIDALRWCDPHHRAGDLAPLMHDVMDVKTAVAPR